MAIFPLEKATEGARREREDETLSGPVVELVAVRSPPRRDTGRPILHPTAGHAGTWAGVGRWVPVREPERQVRGGYCWGLGGDETPASTSVCLLFA